MYMVRHNYQTPNWHNFVNISFIYMKISGSIAKRMLNLQIWN